MITGLVAADIEGLTYGEKTLLATWHKECAGGPKRDFLPMAVRKLKVRERIDLASTPSLLAAWTERERRRVASSLEYFIDGYGMFAPPVGSVEPLQLWPSQREVLHRMMVELVLWILKARRMGLTWMALHEDFWTVAFDERTPMARALVICKVQDDASKLLARTKLMREYMPWWLRPDLPATGARDSATTLRLASGGEILALPGREAAARQETATVVHLDEFAFVPNGRAGPIWTAVQPTIEGGGRLRGISTGNGRAGDGATFADVWDLAQDPANGIGYVFLPWHARPDRTPEWYDAERRKYLTSEAFEQEYPDDPEQALAGDSSISVYPAHAIDAAKAIGRWLADTPHMLELIDTNGIEWGTDWGDFQTFTLYATDLGGGGLFVLDELVQPHVEPSAAARSIIEHEPLGLPSARVVSSHADAAPAGTNATFASVLDDYRDTYPGRFPDEHVRVPFSMFKEGGAERRGVNTVGYVKHMLARSLHVWALIEAGVTDPDLTGCLAIHPQGAPTLCRQLRNLERDVTTGKVKKPSLDPRQLDKGDHGPDALVALSARRAAEWLAEHVNTTEEA